MVQLQSQQSVGNFDLLGKGGGRMLCIPLRE